MRGTEEPARGDVHQPAGRPRRRWSLRSGNIDVGICQPAEAKERSHARLGTKQENSFPAAKMGDAGLAAG